MTQPQLNFVCCCYLQKEKLRILNILFQINIKLMIVLKNAFKEIVVLFDAHT